MPEFPLLTAALAVIAIGAAISSRQGSTAKARAIALVTLVLHGILLLAEHRVPTVSGFPSAAGPVAMDSVNSIPLPFVALLGTALLAIAPSRVLSGGFCTRLLLFVLATDITYAATAPWVMAAGWAMASLVFVPSLDRATIVTFTASSILLAIGIALRQDGHLFLLAGIVLRKGLFPAHGWVVRTFARGSLLPGILLVNAHAGAFVLMRLLPATPAWFTDLALATALYAAIAGLRDGSPRRTLGWLAISQSAFLVAGLESGTTEGFTGSMLLWQVVVASTALLTGTLAAIEARLDCDYENRRSLGLAARAPRLAVGFAVAGLALVGLPCTLGYCAEDLLLHGTLAAHPRIGVLLPIATAMNAVTVLRLFARLFLGPQAPQTDDFEDALPRERVVVVAVLVFLIGGGLAPGPMARLAERAAQAILGPPAAAQGAGPRTH